MSGTARPTKPRFVIFAHNATYDKLHQVATLGLTAAAMGQEVTAQIDVRDAVVHVELLLPPALAFFGQAIEAALKRTGADLLEDKSGRG